METVLSRLLQFRSRGRNGSTSKLTGENFLSFCRRQNIELFLLPRFSSTKEKGSIHSEETGDEETFGDLRRTRKGFRRSRKNDGSTKNKTGDEERGMKNGPGLDRFGFGFEAGPSRGERGSIIGLNLGREDHQERIFSQNGVVDRRHDSTRSPFPRRKRNRNSRRNLSRIDEEGIRRWLQVGARTLGRGIGGIQRQQEMAGRTILDLLK